MSTIITSDGETVKTSQDNHCATLTHLKLLGYGPGDRVLFRGFFPSDSPKKDGGRKAESVFPNLPPDLRQWEIEGRGVYVVVNGGGHKDADVTECRAIFYEHDDIGKEESASLWRGLGLPEPTFQLDTGGKSVHSYWVLTEPISPDLWRRIQTDLLEFADADRSLKNPSRVMRLAGFKHPKTGVVATIISQSGNRYDYETLRAAIPGEQQPEKPKALSWADFDRSFYLPCSENVPLEVCLSKANRALLESGVSEGGRNSSGATLARDLIGTATYLQSLGQRFSGDPRGLFEAYCDRCSPPLPDKERDSIWRSAESKRPGPALAPDQIEGCLKGWAWRERPSAAPVAQPTTVGTAKAPAAAGADMAKPDMLTLDQAKLKLQWAVDEGLKGSDVETLVTDLARQTGHQPQSLQRIYRELDREAELSSAAKEASTDLEQLRAIQGRRLPILEGLHGDGGKLARKLFQVADAMPTALEFLVTTLIPVLATAMGTAHTLVIHATAKYTVRPIFRAIVVAGTGRKKTPAQNAIIEALITLEESAALDYAHELKIYEQEYQEWKEAAGKRKEDVGPEPAKPTRRRYMSQDSTLAARVQIHAENPRGLLLYKDEASAFITERGRFISGKGDGGELEADLSEFNGGAIMSDRKRDGSTFLPKTVINRVGATQFSKLQGLMGSHNDDCGEFARYLFCAADAPPSKIDLSKDVGDIGLTSTVMQLFSDLLTLPEGTYLLSPKAKQAFQTYQHELTDRQIAEDHPSLQSAYPKFETYFGRLILWLHLVNAALAGQSPEPTVDGYTVELARQWTEYYIGQLKLVLAINSPQQELTGDLLKVHDYLKRKGQPISVADLGRANLFPSVKRRDGKRERNPKNRRDYLLPLLGKLVEQGYLSESSDKLYSLPVEPKVELVECQVEQKLSDNSTDSTPYTTRDSELENSKVEWLSDSSPNGNGNGHSPPKHGDRGDHTHQPPPQRDTSPGERLSGHSTNGNGHTQQTVVRDLTEEELAELLGGGGNVP